MVKGKQKYKVIVEVGDKKTSRTVMAKNMGAAEAQVSRQLAGKKHTIMNVYPK